jgi:uncharacterized phage protein (TIGR01671 family)
MSREIKFRAWSKDRKHWEKKLCLYLDNSEIGVVSESFNNIDVKENYILEQYTGIQDRNGNDIYEGDILSCRAWRHPLPVAWVSEKANSDWTGWNIGYDIKMRDAIIIGNIHENPELTT